MPFFYFMLFLPALLFFVRFLMQYTNCDYYHPACKYTALITNPVLKIIGNKSYGNINVSALICMLVLAEVTGALLINYEAFFSETNTLVIFKNIAILLTFNFIMLIWAIFEILSYILIIGGLLSWIQTPTVRPWTVLFFRMTSPITAPLDRIIPPLGMISISYLVAFFILYLINTTVMPGIVNSILGMF